MRELTERAYEANVRHLDDRWIATQWPAVARRLSADRFAFEWQACTAAERRVLRRLAEGRFRGPGPPTGEATPLHPLPIPNQR